MDYYDTFWIQNIKYSLYIQSFGSMKSVIIDIGLLRYISNSKYKKKFSMFNHAVPRTAWLYILDYYDISLIKNMK